MSGIGGRPGTMSGFRFRSRESPGLGPEPGLKATDSRDRDKNEREIPRDGKSCHFGTIITRDVIPDLSRPLPIPVLRHG